MNNIFLSLFLAVLFSTIAALYFFVTTRGSLIWTNKDPGDPTKHIYAIYKKHALIRFTDHDWLISAILLFQYNKLVDRITQTVKRHLPREGTVLMTACAFGNVIPRLAKASVEAGVGNVLFIDLIDNQLKNAEAKIPPEYRKYCEFIIGDATRMDLPDDSVSMNVLYFLFHELPLEDKEHALREAMRVVKPGGRLVIAEFHPPSNPILRLLSGLYFSVYERDGIPLWNGSFDLIQKITAHGQWEATHTRYFYDNYQVVDAIKIG